MSNEVRSESHRAWRLRSREKVRGTRELQAKKHQVKERVLVAGNFLWMLLSILERSHICSGKLEERTEMSVKRGFVAFVQLNERDFQPDIKYVDRRRWGTNNPVLS